MSVCRVCGGELWWAGSIGVFAYLHVDRLGADHVGLPRRRSREADRV